MSEVKKCSPNKHKCTKTKTKKSSHLILWGSTDYLEAGFVRSEEIAFVRQKNKGDESGTETTQPRKARRSSERCFTIMLHWRAITSRVKEDYTGLNRSSGRTCAFLRSLIWGPYRAVEFMKLCSGILSLNTVCLEQKQCFAPLYYMQSIKKNNQQNLSILVAVAPVGYENIFSFHIMHQ